MHLREFSHSYSLDLSRKLGDSNPRYGYPYGSLANCWFQPLTQTSKGTSDMVTEAKHHFLIAGAKVAYSFDTAKYFDNFF